MKVDVLTIFPEIIAIASRVGLLAKAQEKRLLSIRAIDIRDYSFDKHHKVDDTPYGGGAGMVLQVAPIVSALEALSPAGRAQKILLSPRGELLTQKKVRELSGYDQLVFVCGRYEGVDERVGEFVDLELSIGDYILAGGEFAALVIIDAVARLIPGVVGDPHSLTEESLEQGLLEYPHYTRPADFRGFKVPELLLTGNHEAIRRWRQTEAQALTLKRRPDLLKK